MSSSRTLSRKRRTSFTCIKPRFGPSIILLYIAASVEQYCDITQVNALPENEWILEGCWVFKPKFFNIQPSATSCDNCISAQLVCLDCSICTPVRSNGRLLGARDSFS